MILIALLIFSVRFLILIFHFFVVPFRQEKVVCLPVVSEKGWKPPKLDSATSSAEQNYFHEYPALRSARERCRTTYKERRVSSDSSSPSDAEDPDFSPATVRRAIRRPFRLADQPVARGGCQLLHVRDTDFVGSLEWFETLRRSMMDKMGDVFRDAMLSAPTSIPSSLFSTSTIPPASSSVSTVVSVASTFNVPLDDTLSSSNSPVAKAVDYAPRDYVPRAVVPDPLDLNIEADQTTCHVCSQSFTTHYLLSIHMSCHDANSKFQCLKCSKSFASQGDMRKHEVSHRASAELKCSFPGCSKVLKTRAVLVQHEKDHKDDGSNPCAYGCSYVAPKKRYLATHYLSCPNRPDKDLYFCPHEGCTYHSSGFRRRNLLLDHLRTKHGNRT